MNRLLWTYRVVRSVLFTAVILVAFLYVASYILLSMPTVQRRICRVAERELSALTGGRLTIGEADISPFNEVVVADVTLYEPATDSVCAHIGKLGAGISLLDLFWRRRIVVTYAELLDFKASLRQDSAGAPLNIQFLIDAFSGKDKSKPPARFDLAIQTIVIRRSEATFSRPWLPAPSGSGLDMRRLRLKGLNADVIMPRLSNDTIEVDLRRLAFTLNDRLAVDHLAAYVTVDHGDISVKGFSLETPGGTLSLNDQTIPLASGGGMRRLLQEHEFRIEMNGENLNPSYFSSLAPQLALVDLPLDFTLAAAGNAARMDMTSFTLKAPGHRIDLGLKDVYAERDTLTPTHASLPRIGWRVAIGELDMHLSPAFTSAMGAHLRSKGDARGASLVEGAGEVTAKVSGHFRSHDFRSDLTLQAGCGYGSADIKGSVVPAGNGSDRVTLKASLSDAGIPALMPDIARLTAKVEADALLSTERLLAIGRKPPHGVAGWLALCREAGVEATVENADYRGRRLENIRASLSRKGGGARLTVESPVDDLDFSLDATLAETSDGAYALRLLGDFDDIRPRTWFPSAPDISFAAGADMALQGTTLDDLTGTAVFTGLSLSRPAGSAPLTLGRLAVNSEIGDAGRRYTVDSDWLTADIAGHFTPSHLPEQIRGMLAEVMPMLVPPKPVAKKPRTDADAQLEYALKIAGRGEWMDYLRLPVRLPWDADISGRLSTRDSTLTLAISAPYIQQGASKLIRHTDLDLAIRGPKADLRAYSEIPTKKGMLRLGVDAIMNPAATDINLEFNKKAGGGFYGDLDLTLTLTPGLNRSGYGMALDFHPSALYLNGARWTVDRARAEYDGRRVTVRDFSVGHDLQYLTVNGVAGPGADDVITATLSDIDLDYIFDTLNINYVSFGGRASGRAIGRALFSPSPEAFTEHLDVESLSYNGGVLGDGALTGTFDARQMRVGIGARVAEGGRRVADIDGGIWLKKDSLSFGIDADKVRIDFLQPFMAAFASKVEGRASGQAQLYGTFSDIDMRGRLFADTIAMKVDFTNVTYCGRDSVIIDPGRIIIPSFRLYDTQGHHALLSGTLEHRYFHDPTFSFRIHQAEGIMLYDTNPQINPVWYGRLFGHGLGEIFGRPGYVGIRADMIVTDDSHFTFVLDDTKEAVQYSFLTFTDTRKARREEEARLSGTLTATDEIEREFNRRTAAQTQADESVFAMDIRATIDEKALMTLVMDPRTGDKINARGNGALNITYASDSNEMKMYGKYTLAGGSYNFSLQDLILKDFVIKSGSTIAFNGDPMNAMLDIRAAYRVNTNLTDLDKSFATERDLNRSNVPVDAMLLVSGEMRQPDISFDIELPTISAEVAQKVRSIISSEDMMNKQMIYLLALNRFYTPEYSGAQSGGEWASVASSTLSSQLQNMLGQLTDKVAVAPSVRSDKGDFSDLEVDLALSSRLFNNRLLVNGTFGYRDPATSSTTFIGDFDIEYLLTSSGNLRLKAYNHFNDQNYYLKSALTTQGVGIVWRKDFDRLRRRPPLVIARPRTRRDTVPSEDLTTPGPAADKDPYD